MNPWCIPRLINAVGSLGLFIGIVGYIRFSFLAVDFFPTKIPKSLTSFNSHGCKIPRPPVMPPFFSLHWRPNFTQNCSYERRLMIVEREKKLTLLPGSGADCCYQEIKRGSSDNDFHFSDCKPVESNDQMNGPSAVLMSCGEAINGDIILEPTSATIKKLDFWQNSTSDERPFSVLIIGIDTASRSHAYRSLPWTIGTLKSLEFQDFDSFHSVAPNTLSNLLALLGGIKKEDFHKSCVKDWTESFDNCDLIWKAFSARNYVTSFIEDGMQSFNWGGKSGFVHPPVDYYWHHFFKALQEVRQHQFQKFGLNGKTYSQECSSSETVSEFMLRYSLRFVQKFKSVPSFLLTWLAYPFHDEIYSLSAFDKVFNEFLHSLQRQSEILKRTLIIIMSDHGDRFSEFSGKSVESFIERVNPMLFIRMPDYLRIKFPEMYQALQSNSKKFVTPFDLYETLHHILSMNSLFRRTTQGDRRSNLLHSISEERNCDDLSISSMNCICNIQYNPIESSDDLQLNYKTQELIDTVVNWINVKVQSSNYARVCAKWSSGADKIIYLSTIERTNDQVELLVAFGVEPGGAEFEARVKVPTTSRSAQVEGSVVIVGVSRTSRYRDQSWCVGFQNDKDKEMKEFCYCKNPPPPSYRQNFIEKFFKLM